MFAEVGFCLPNFFGKLKPMPDQPQQDLKRFGEIVRNRRIELGLTQEGVAANGGPSDTTLTKIENLEWNPARPNDTLRKLDTGLDWRPGSARAVLHGGDPAVVSDYEELPRQAYQAEVIGRLSKEVGDHPNYPNELPNPAHTPAERGLLAVIRNKVARGESLDELENQLLRATIEGWELASLHQRVDLLPRPEKLEVSHLVDQLLERVDIQQRKAQSDEDITQQRSSTPSPFHGGTSGSPEGRKPPMNEGGDKPSDLTIGSKGDNVVRPNWGDNSVPPPSLDEADAADADYDGESH